LTRSKDKSKIRTLERAGFVHLKPSAIAKDITATDVRQEALENFAGSLARVTEIANGVCYVSVKERCMSCGQQPGPELEPGQLLKLVPRPAEITQANALLAKISLPAQTESLGLAEGQALIEATIGRFMQLAIDHGVPVPVAQKWFVDSTQPLKVA